MSSPSSGSSWKWKWKSGDGRRARCSWPEPFWEVDGEGPESFVLSKYTGPVGLSEETSLVSDRAVRGVRVPAGLSEETSLVSERAVRGVRVPAEVSEEPGSVDDRVVHLAGSRGAEEQLYSTRRRSKAASRPGGTALKGVTDR